MLFLVLCIASCKLDTAIDPGAQTIEEAYFDDYESPREKWGYMDTKGNTVIKPKFDDVRDMLGLLTAANYKGKWGFIDLKGQTVIDFQYKQVQDFNADFDRAFVQDFNNQWLMINVKNSIVDSMSFDNFKQFVGDYCPVSLNGAWGVIDKTGAPRIPLSYDLIKIINDDRVIAKKYGKQGIINMSNETKLDFIYKKISICESNMIRVRDDKGYCFYDISTLQIKSPDFRKASLIKDGYFYAENSDFKAIYTDDFKFLKAMNYDRVEYANQQRWVYKKDGLWGLLDGKGDPITPPSYELINKYEEDIILFSNNDLWGYLDLEGRIFIPAELPLAWEYKNGYARILHRRGVGFIDKTKTLVIDERVFEVRDFYNGLARFQTL